jgi:hypothetical protein
LILFGIHSILLFRNGLVFQENILAINNPQEKKMSHEPTILTHTGLTFNLLHPTAEMICIEDIAYALAHICRFGGHTNHFYSVAQHSVLVSHIVPKHLALEGLLHDAAEAYVGDMVKPLKNLLPAYSDIEINIERVIFEKFGFSIPLDPLVKVSDIILLNSERRDVMPSTQGMWDKLNGVDSLPDTIVAWSSSSAKDAFLDRFKLLTTF